MRTTFYIPEKPDNLTNPSFNPMKLKIFAKDCQITSADL